MGLKQSFGSHITILAFGVLFVAHGRSASGQSTASSVARPTSYIFGARYCNQCHSHPENYKIDNVICRMGEALTWERNDKHRKAFETFAIKDSLAQRIGLNLGINVTTDKACIACHSVSEANPGKNSDAKIPTLQFEKTTDGVSCVACHGSAREWVFEHVLFEDASWRGLSRAKKQSEKGMVDLWNPVQRTKTCISCHVGNAVENKVLTHAMYAAGHPMLPSVEVFTFSQAMPRHWEYLGEKLARLGTMKPEVRRAIERNFNLKRLEHTELVAVSGIVSLRETLALFVAQAESKHDAKAPWPDFARFDCASCHHDLKTPGWRQERAEGYPPGRPSVPVWTTTLVSLGIEAAGPEKASARLADFELKLRALHDAVAARPFGDTTQAIKGAKALIAWADTMIADLNHLTIDRKAAGQLLVKLRAKAEHSKPDYDTARQLFWAYKAIYEEYDSSAPASSPIPTLLKSVESQFGFELPAAGLQQSIEASVAKRLKVFSDFDSNVFLNQFMKIPRQVE